MSRRSTLSLGLLASGCAHAAASGAASPPCPAPEPQFSEPVGLYDVVWHMRSADIQASWSPIPDTLHAFSLGSWECALGPLQSNDSVTRERASIERARRLACTDKTGATVQSELRCQVVLPLAASAAADARRELELTLSGAPEARFACEPASRERLEALPGGHAALCLTGTRLHPCATSTLQAESSAR